MKRTRNMILKAKDGLIIALYIIMIACCFAGLLTAVTFLAFGVINFFCFAFGARVTVSDVLWQGLTVGILGTALLIYRMYRRGKDE